VLKVRFGLKRSGDITECLRHIDQRATSQFGRLSLVILWHLLPVLPRLNNGPRPAGYQRRPVANSTAVAGTRRRFGAPSLTADLGQFGGGGLGNPDQSGGTGIGRIYALRQTMRGGCIVEKTAVALYCRSARPIDRSEPSG
jgi:hypothetical protein